MRNVLVTGGTGFIGSNLAAALVREGHNVRILRRASSDLRATGSIDADYIIGDVRDPDSVRKAIKGCDTVFHVAALVSYWKRRRQELYDINVGGTANIVQACLEYGIEKMVHTSSVAAVGFAGNRVLANELTEFNWDAHDVGYRISKSRAEREVLRGVERGLPAVIVNPSVVVGERDLHFNGGQIIRDVYRKRIFYDVRGGFSIVYVGDVVKGHLEAARRGRIGQRYILSGENLTHREILSITADVVGGFKPLFRLPLWMTKGLAAASESFGNLANRKPWITRELVAGIGLTVWFSCEKAKRELNYSVTPFRTAVRRTFEWYRNEQML
ncbi:MAG: SDR family oxidoreductase [Ignavibacteriales bacterium]|nr:SDR family oxidoreductase [Ignavibacteriales bacterium]